MGYKGSVVVIGANGYIGSALCTALYKLNCVHPFDEDKLTYVIPVTRESYKEASEGNYHTIINCAMPGKRYWVNQNPEQDYVETVEKTKNLIKNWQYNKFIQISTVSARCDSDSVYGKHKLLAEELCKSIPNVLIYRLTSTYDSNLSRGVLTDILKGKVYVSEESSYAFSSLDFVTNWIANHLDRSGIIELGAKNTIKLKEIVDYLRLNVEFEGRIENQEVMNPEEDFPDVRLVLPFMEHKLKEYVK